MRLTIYAKIIIIGMLTRLIRVVAVITYFIFMSAVWHARKYARLSDEACVRGGAFIMCQQQKRNVYMLNTHVLRFVCGL